MFPFVNMAIVIIQCSSLDFYWRGLNTHTKVPTLAIKISRRSELNCGYTSFKDSNQAKKCLSVSLLRSNESHKSVPATLLRLTVQVFVASSRFLIEFKFGSSQSEANEARLDEDDDMPESRSLEPKWTDPCHGLVNKMSANFAATKRGHKNVRKRLAEKLSQGDTSSEMAPIMQSDMVLDVCLKPKFIHMGEKGHLIGKMSWPHG